jgi:competence protein ComEA
MAARRPRGTWSGGPCAAAILLALGTLRISSAADQDPTLVREQQSLQAVCGKCHSLQVVMDTPMGYDNWHDTVQKMIDQGAQGSDEQFDDIMDYLHRTMTTIDVNAADAGELEIVLNVPARVAKAVIARRTRRKFADLADLKSVPGIDGPSLDGKARLIFFQ